MHAFVMFNFSSLYLGMLETDCGENQTYDLWNANLYEISSERQTNFAM